MSRAILLGTGTSMGVPVIGCSCEVCTSNDPRDRRRRVAAVIEDDAGSRVLIDTPPELRLQLLAAEVPAVDAVLFTHEHADHTHGIDDLRAISQRNGELPLYGSAATLAEIQRRFDYIFDPGVVPPKGTGKPRLRPHPITADAPIEVAGMVVRPITFSHGVTDVLGYRFGSFAYLTDVKTVSDAAMEALAGIRVLVINALFDKPHPTHLSIGEAVAVAEALEVEHAYLTHLTHRFRHAELAGRLPAGVAPAYDGLTIAF